MSTEILCSECGNGLYELGEIETGMCQKCQDELNLETEGLEDANRI
jgi:hypothetical protein